MNIQEAFVTCRSKYAIFGGRASRSEFWWFQLAVISLGIVMSYFSNRGGPPLSDFGPLLFNLAVLSPTLAVGSRRLHDVGRSGWWQLLIFTIVGLFVLLYWWVQPSQPGPNQYGEEPEVDEVLPKTAPQSPFRQPMNSASAQLATDQPPQDRGSKTALPPEPRKGMLDWTQRGKDA